MVYTQPTRAGRESLPHLYLRNCRRSSRELVLLPPAGYIPPKLFQRQEFDPGQHHDFMAEMQTLRGEVYLEEGAITSRQISGGRHQATADAGSWHLLMLDDTGHVCGCARYKEHPRQAGFASMLAASAALAACPSWGAKLVSAVEAELALARRFGLSCVELGGWALSDKIRGSSDALRMVLTTYGLAQTLGAGLGISTATHRNGSAAILRKIGARPFEYGGAELPAYHDPQYRCEMEILRFYFFDPNPRYKSWIEEVRTQILQMRVIADLPEKTQWGLAPSFETTGGFEQNARLAS